MGAASIQIGGLAELIGEREVREGRRTRGLQVRADDERLAASLAAGEEAALEQLWRRFGGTLLGYLVSTLRDRGEAEDVHQQVFLEAWRRRREYDPGRAGPFTWLMTIARSRAIDSMRRRRPELLADGVDSREPSVEGPEEDALRRWRVAQLLRRIPAEEATLLRMRFFEELSQREIAERTGLPLGTVKMRMVDALGRLRDLVDAEEAR